MCLVLSGKGRLVSDDLNCVGMWEDREKSCFFRRDAVEASICFPTTLDIGVTFTLLSAVQRAFQEAGNHPHGAGSQRCHEKRNCKESREPTPPIFIQNVSNILFNVAVTHHNIVFSRVVEVKRSAMCVERVRCVTIFRRNFHPKMFEATEHENSEVQWGKIERAVLAQDWYCFQCDWDRHLDGTGKALS